MSSQSPIRDSHFQFQYYSDLVSWSQNYVFQNCTCDIIVKLPGDIPNITGITVKFLIDVPEEYRVKYFTDSGVIYVKDIQTLDFTVVNSKESLKTLIQQAQVYPYENGKIYFAANNFMMLNNTKDSPIDWSELNLTINGKYVHTIFKDSISCDYFNISNINNITSCFNFVQFNTVQQSMFSYIANYSNTTPSQFNAHPYMMVPFSIQGTFSGVCPISTNENNIIIVDQPSDFTGLGVGKVYNNSKLTLTGDYISHLHITNFGTIVIKEINQQIEPIYIENNGIIQIYTNNLENTIIYNTNTLELHNPVGSGVHINPGATSEDQPFYIGTIVNYSQTSIDINNLLACAKLVNRGFIHMKPGNLTPQFTFYGNPVLTQGDGAYRIYPEQTTPSFQLTIPLEDEVTLDVKYIQQVIVYGVVSLACDSSVLNIESIYIPQGGILKNAVITQAMATVLGITYALNFPITNQQTQEGVYYYNHIAKINNFYLFETFDTVVFDILMKNVICGNINTQVFDVPQSSYNYEISSGTSGLTIHSDISVGNITANADLLVNGGRMIYQPSVGTLQNDFNVANEKIGVDLYQLCKAVYNYSKQIATGLGFSPANISTEAFLSLDQL